MENEHVLDKIARYFGEDQATKISYHGLPFLTDDINLKSPPGLTGKIVDWINQGSHYLREHLAVIAALTAIGNVAGLKYRDDIWGDHKFAVNLYCRNWYRQGLDNCCYKRDYILCRDGWGMLWRSEVKARNKKEFN